MASVNEKTVSVKKPKLILKCSKVTKKIGNGLKLLKDCSFSAYKGEAIAILAPANNSKTTFAKIICGLVPPTSGEITIRGNKAGRNTNQFVSYQPEIPFVRSESTVLDYMNMYNRFFKDFNFKRAFKLLKQFKISPRTKFEDLSITAVQIVETVLVSCRKTSLYVFDDPLAHADPKYRKALIDIMGSCKKLGAVVIFSQISDGLSKISDKIILLKKGEIYVALSNKDYDNDEKKFYALYKEVFRKNA
ncbi:MAG: ATP-binding cassette domain-containing protein [Lachnospirales bacterium]